MDRAATEPQIDRLRRDAEKYNTHDVVERAIAKGLSIKEASALITWMTKLAPADRPEAPDAGLTQGIYEKDGEVYLVKKSGAGRYYAKRMIVLSEGSGPRLTEAGTEQKIEFEYDRGAVFKLRPEDRMSEARAQELTIQYGRCIACGRKLYVSKSVKRGMGPQCRKKWFTPSSQVA